VVSVVITAVASFISMPQIAQAIEMGVAVDEGNSDAGMARSLEV
jgi:hypothetical protein